VCLGEVKVEPSQGYLCKSTEGIHSTRVPRRAVSPNRRRYGGTLMSLWHRVRTAQQAVVSSNAAQHTCNCGEVVCTGYAQVRTRDIRSLACWLIPSQWCPAECVARLVLSPLGWEAWREGLRTGASQSFLDEGSCGLGPTPREGSGGRTPNAGL
jgi:hypothetical protein